MYSAEGKNCFLYFHAKFSIRKILIKVYYIFMSQYVSKLCFLYFYVKFSIRRILIKVYYIFMSKRLNKTSLNIICCFEQHLTDKHFN